MTTRRCRSSVRSAPDPAWNRIDVIDVTTKVSPEPAVAAMTTASLVGLTPKIILASWCEGPAEELLDIVRFAHVAGGGRPRTRAQPLGFQVGVREVSKEGVAHAQRILHYIAVCGMDDGASDSLGAKAEMRKLTSSEHCGMDGGSKRHEFLR